MTIKEIINELNIAPKTWYNWQKTRPEMIQIIKLGLEAKKHGLNDKNQIKVNGNNNTINHKSIIVNGEDISNELCNDIAKLPEKEKKRIHLEIQLKLLDMEEE